MPVYLGYEIAVLLSMTLKKNKAYCKHILIISGSFKMEVNICGGLRFGKSADVIMRRDALSEVRKDVSFKNGFEVFRQTNYLFYDVCEYGRHCRLL